MNDFDYLEWFYSLLASLLVTVLIYGAFPLIFAKARKTPITAKKYRIICHGVNAIGLIVCFAITSNPAEVGPYFLWTTLFSRWGVKILDSECVLIENQETTENSNSNNDVNKQTIQTSLSDTSVSENMRDVSSNHLSVFPKIVSCRNCGAKLPEHFCFCTECGTKIATDTPPETVTDIDTSKCTLPAETINELKYALKYQTDEGMINYLKNTKNETIQDVLKLPSHLIRQQIKNLLNGM